MNDSTKLEEQIQRLEGRLYGADRWKDDKGDIGELKAFVATLRSWWVLAAGAIVLAASVVGILQFLGIGSG